MSVSTGVDNQYERQIWHICGVESARSRCQGWNYLSQDHSMSWELLRSADLLTHLRVVVNATIDYG